ncbi:MAG: hypothetical protein CVU18_15055 [Betaproteobacteria bacterium HGW-Betaproteobacteria-12]|nr:MAG: hypothetical protein CVU18_15055 [Betaproteobacteria bacterium HGW-Betaproteobacteria-12]
MPAATILHLAVVLLAVLPSAACLADACDELPKPAVKVERLESQVALNTRYGVKALNNLGATVSRPGHQVLGLTRGTASASLAVHSPTLVDSSGRWECASPQITLRYGFSPITVYVAREFPPGSCAHQQIYEHEMRHVKTYEEHLVNLEKDLLATLNARFATGGPWRGKAGDIGPRLRRELDQRWLPMVQREIRRVEAAQALIDTDEEYARVADACDGAIKKVIR